MSGSPSPIPRSWLEPIRQLVGLYQEYGSLPRAIAGIISLYVVNSVLNIGGYIVNSVLLLSDIITGSIAQAQLIVRINAFLVGTGILNALRRVQLEIGTAIETLGPLGPPVAIGITAVMFWLAYEFVVRAGVALAGELPIGSSIVDFLGLR